MFLSEVPDVGRSAGVDGLSGCVGVVGVVPPLPSVTDAGLQGFEYTAVLSLPE